jgi:hypothetical protein
MRFRRVNSFLSIVVTFFISFQQLVKAAESTIFPNLNIDYDAKSAAMAGAAVAVAEGASAVLSNPAATVSVENNQAFIGYRTIIDGVWGSPVVYSRSFEKVGVFSVLICGIDAEIEEVIDESFGEPIFTGKTGGAQYLTGAMSWGYGIRKDLSVGATLKGLYNRLNDGNIIYSAKAVAMDAGISYRTFGNRLTLGAAIRNAGFLLKSFDENRYPMPFTIEAGLSFVGDQLSSVRMALDVNKKKGDRLTFEPAVDVNIYKKMLSLRLGYAFSDKDLKQFFRKLGGREDENYVKTNWNTFCTGLGFIKKIENATVGIDLAMQFHAIVITPSTIVSAFVDF